MTVRRMVRQISSNLKWKVQKVGYILWSGQGKQGLGTAYIAGFKWALDRHYEYIFEMDADFSHNPHDLLRLLAACENGADMSVGSRYVKGGNVENWPWDRVMLSYWASVYVRFITWLPVKDTTAGFVCFTRKGIGYNRLR